MGGLLPPFMQSFSITAFPVLCRILTDLKMLDDAIGVIVLSAGVGNDIVSYFSSLCFGRKGSDGEVSRRSVGSSSLWLSRLSTQALVLSRFMSSSYRYVIMISSAGTYWF